MNKELIFEDLPQMEEKCIDCAGTGQIDIYETIVGKKKNKVVKIKTSCKICKGHGNKLTKFGISLIELVDRWSSFKNDIVDMKHDIVELERCNIKYDKQWD